MKKSHLVVFRLRAIVALWGVLSCDVVAGSVVDEFQSEHFEVNDRFKIDSRGDYAISGNVEWAPLELTLKPESSILIAKTLDPKIRFDVDLWPGALKPSEVSHSSIHLLLTNGWELTILIARAEHRGQTVRQAAITELNRNDQAEKPSITVLRQLPPFLISGDVERWSIQYNYGVLKLVCNAKTIGEVYSRAFSSWIKIVAVKQRSRDVVISSVKFSGETVGYSEQQQKSYVRINEFRAQAGESQTRGELGVACDLERKAIRSAELAFGEDDFSVGLMRSSLAERLLLLQQAEEAKKEYELSRQIMSAAFGASHPETLARVCFLAELRVEEGDHAEAISDLRKSVTRYRKLVAGENALAMASRLVAALDAQTTWANFEGDFILALKNSREALALCKSAFGDDGVRTQKAAEGLDFQIRVKNSEGKEREYFLQYFKLSQALDKSTAAGKTSRSVSLRTKLESLARDLFPDGHPRLAWTLIGRSIDLFNEGRVDRAISASQDAIEMLSRHYGDEHVHVSYAMGHLGSQYSMAGYYDEASTLLDNACDALVKIDHADTQEFATLRLDQGRHLIRMGMHSEAAPFLSEALQVFHSLGLYAEPNALKTLERLADVHRSQGNLTEAERIIDFHRNVTLAAYGKENPYYVDILMSEARHLYMRKKFREAMDKYIAAGALAEIYFGEYGRPQEAVLHGLIEVSLARGDMSDVARYFEKRLEYELYHRENLFNISSETEQLAQSQRNLRSLDGLLILALQGHIEPRRAYNHAVAFKGAVSSRQRGTKIAMRSSEAKKLLEELTNLDSELAASANSEELQFEQGRLKKLHIRRREIFAQLTELNEPYRLAVSRTRVDKLRETLPSGVVLVDYYEYQKPREFFESLFGLVPQIGLVGFVITKNQDVELIDLGSIDEINKASVSWRRGMSSEIEYAQSPDYPKVVNIVDERGRQLRKRIWDPIVPHLGGAKTVVVSPSIHLSATSFAALPKEEDDSFLIEEYTFVNIASLRLLPELLSGKQSSGPPKLLLVGDIDFGSPPAVESDSSELAKDTAPLFRRLPSADREISPIRDSFVDWRPAGKAGMMTGKYATEALVRQHIHGVQYVHFHTHGFCLGVGVITDSDQQPVSESESLEQVYLSGIALAGGNQGLLSQNPSSNDGILWSEEIASLDLSNAELVTLSACQTALGDPVPGEGMLGAHRALHIAGARSSLTALWEVADDATRELMVQFYARLWGQGQPKAAALQGAMIHMLREYDWQGDGKKDSGRRTPPALWAGFTLHGDWR